MNVFRALQVSVLLAGLVGTAHAESDFLEVITAHYKIGDSSALAEKSCGICHVSDSDFALNPYGKDVSLEMTKKGASMLTASILQTLEPLDSDGDGATNSEELGADTPPGDAVVGPFQSSPTISSTDQT